MQLSQFDPLAAGLAFGFLASGNNSFLCAPPAGYDVSTVLISDNFAVIPGEWESGSISKPTTNFTLPLRWLKEYQNRPSMKFRAVMRLLQML